MYAGEVVEQGPVGRVFARPRHPYTLALLECLPRVERPRRRAAAAGDRGLPARPAPTADALPVRPALRAWRTRAAARSARLVRAVAPDTALALLLADAVPAPGRHAAARPTAPAGRATPVRASSTRPRLVHHYRRGAAGSSAPAPGPSARSTASHLAGPGRRWRSSGRAARARRRWRRCVVGLLAADGGRDPVRRRSVPRDRRRTGPAPSAGVSRSSSRIPTSR